jgi:hypothetical protein
MENVRGAEVAEDLSFANLVDIQTCLNLFRLSFPAQFQAIRFEDV